MGILEEAKSTLTLLTKVKAVSEGASEADAIDQLRIELVKLSAPIRQLSSRALVFRQEGVGLSQVPELKIVTDTVIKSRDRFVENPKATTLRNSTRWTTLTKKLETIATAGAATQANDWKTFFEENFFVGLPPAQRGAKLAKTPENTKAINQYQTTYQSFIKYRSQPPNDLDGFNTLRSLSNQLAEIVFQEEVPDDVRKFMDATSFGAGLDLLTPSVLEWLRENNLLTNYTVRAKS